MRNVLVVCAAMVWVAAASSARAQDALKTVSDYANALSQRATRLDAMGADRQKAGDMAGAQRVALVAEILRRSGEEFRGAEADSLIVPANKLDDPVPARLADLVAVSQDALQKAPADPEFVETALRAANALLDVVPIIPPHPIVYGALSRDLTPDPLPADIVVYGRRLVDPLLKRQPVATVAGTYIDTLEARADRIFLTLPAAAKAAVGFAPAPCDSRAGFALRLEEEYAIPRGYWPFNWHTESTSVADLFLPPSPAIYEAKVTARVEAPKGGLAKTPFEARAVPTTASCEQTLTAEVEVPLPPHAQNVDCVASWVDVTGAAHTTSRCATQDGALRATGEITGGALVCSPTKLCTCNVMAQGVLQAKGAYDVEVETGQLTPDDQTRSLVFPAGGSAQTALSGRGLRHVFIDISRRACPAAVDAIDASISADPGARSTAASAKGAFRFVYADGRLTVGSAEVFAPDAQKTP